MAMTKPIVDVINAFDGSQNHTFTFTSVGGDQVVKNEILIKDNETNVEVYNHTVTSYVFEQTVVANTLQNGKRYNVSFRTYGADNTASEWSNATLFYCYTTPQLGLNVTSGQRITSATFTFDLSYAQAENELLDYAFIEIYDANTDSVIQRSKNLYKSATPPFTLSYTFEGFLDETFYKVKATTVTVEQTVTETELIDFYVKYDKPQLYSNLELTSKNCDGYINIETNYVDISGQPHPIEPIYKSDGTITTIDLCGSDQNILHKNTSYNVLWNQGFTIPTNFVLRMWFTPSCIGGNILHLKSSTTSEFVNISYERNQDGDFINITTDSGTDISRPTNIINNGTARYYLWIKVVDNNWEINLKKIADKETSIFNFNDYNNNVSWNMTTDLTWIDDQSYEHFTPSISVSSLQSPLDTIIVGNGIFEHLNITKDITLQYSEDYPIWDYKTIFDCDFDNSINGGNINVLLSQLSSVRVKRRDSNSLTWTTIYEQNVTKSEDLNINIKDPFVPSFVEQTYAFIPILNGNIEGDYVIATVTPQWKGTFLTDGEKIFKLYNSVLYESTTQNTQMGVLTPIGAKYPIIIQNAETNYRSGTLSFQLCGYDFEKTHIIKRDEVVKQTNELLDFLSNGKAKCLIDWNGNDIIFKVISAPSVSYHTNYGNGIVNIAFSWAEQGQYDNQEDLRSLGLTKF